MMIKRKSRQSNRRGMTTLDYVMVTAVVVPLTAALFWAVYRLFVEMYLFISTVMGWPFF